MLWALLLINLFLRMGFTEILLNGSRGFPQPAIFQSRLLDMPINWLMPMIQQAWNLAAALPTGMEFLPQAVFCWLTALLLFGAATALNAPFARLAAPVLFFLFLSSPINGIDPNAATFKEDMLYAFACSMVAYALILRGRTARRTACGELLLAASIGISFMVKSPLVFLPPVLAAYDIATGKLRRGETSWLLLITLCALPYAMLLPWTGMNWWVYDIFTLFEHGRGSDNIISGALGIVYAIEGGVLPTAGIPDSTNIPLWAVKTVLSHPLAYTGSVLQRLLTEFSWYPLLPTAFLAAFLRFRKNEQFRLLGIFILYFVTIHSLLSIDARYFYPIYPALILGAAALFDTRGMPPTISVAKRIFAVLFLPLAAAYLFTSWNLIQYAATALPAVNMVAKLENAKKTPYATALTFAAKQELAKGEIDTAYAHARAALLRQNSYETIKTYAQTLAASGRSTLPVLQQHVLDCGEYKPDCLLLRSLEAFKNNNYAEGRKNFYLAYQTHKARAFWFCGSDAKTNPELYGKHRHNAEQLALEQWFSQFLAALPSKEADEYKKVLSQPNPLVLTDGQNRVDLLIGEYIVSGKELLNTPCESRADNAELRQLADQTVKMLRASHTPESVRQPVYSGIPERSRQEQALEYMRACRAHTADNETSRLAIILLERLAGEDNSADEAIAGVTASCINPDDIVGTINSHRDAGTAISLGRKYLRLRPDPLVLSCVKEREAAFMPQEEPPCAPDWQFRRRELTALHGNKRYAELITRARAYLENCPHDHSATLYLADALIATDDYQAAKKCLSEAEQLPLEPNERAWANALKRDLEKAQMSSYFKNLSRI